MTKLYRSRTDSKLFGLCGGLAQMINVDSTLLRVIVIITAFFSGGTVIPIYFIACLVIPKEPAFDFPDPASHGPYYGPNYRPTPGRNTGYYGGSQSAGHTTGFQPSGARSYGQGQPNPPSGFGPQPGPQAPGPQGQEPVPGQPFPPRESTVDEMMRDMEKKMLQREIDELRAKLAQYELKNRNPGPEGGNEER